MTTEFKIEVNLKEFDKFYQIHACVRCIQGECESVIKQLEEEYWQVPWKRSQEDIDHEGDENIEDYLCLIMMKLKIKKGSKREIFMSDFYNNVTKLGRGLSHLSKKLKGGARAILCMILLKALNAGLIGEQDEIHLEASGDLEDDIGNQKDMMGLVNYYKMLGFKITNENNLDEQLEDMSVYMYETVGKILDR